MANWGFGQLGVGNLLNESQRTGLREHWCEKNKTVTKEVYRNLLVSKLIPAIFEKWLSRDRVSRKLFVQQDSAKNLIREDDKEFHDALMEQNIDAVLYMQTLNSPDVNLLDLGF